MTELVEVHVGIDDTDSINGGCTTYIASLAAQLLAELGASFIDYPCLVRLNPNIPWKTRGNGAVALRFKIPRGLYRRAFDELCDLVERRAEMSDPSTHPAIAACLGPPRLELRRLAEEALSYTVDVGKALQVARSLELDLRFFKEPRGVVGALAAIGELLEGDHTYELIAYRRREFLGGPRRVDEASVAEMDEATRPYTFNNLDYETRRVLITPRGPDPVLYGIRGESPEAVKRAQRLLRVEEPLERWTVFRTNHGTDAHLKPATTKASDYQAVAIRGVVASKPIAVKGGHVIFKLSDEHGVIDCAAYEPTGSFRKIVASLRPQDEVIVYGGVRPAEPGRPRTVNLEKLLVVKLATMKVLVNPACQTCGLRLESMGRLKGYRCPRCRTRYPRAEKEEIEKPRNLAEALYIPPPRAQRHLTKPYSRYGREKSKCDLKPPIDASEFLWVAPR